MINLTEAVETAAKAEFYAAYPATYQWEQVRPDVADRIRDSVRTAVEAAAPIVEEAVWTIVNDILREAGLEYPLHSAGVRDLVMQRDGQIDRAEEAEGKLAALVTAIRAEIHHASDNGHVLSGDSQGVAPGEKVPAVRISNIEAAIEGSA